MGMFNQQRWGLRTTKAMDFHDKIQGAPLKHQWIDSPQWTANLINAYLPTFTLQNDPKIVDIYIWFKWIDMEPYGVATWPPKVSKERGRVAGPWPWLGPTLLKHVATIWDQIRQKTRTFVIQHPKISHKQMQRSLMWEISFDRGTCGTGTRFSCFCGW